MLTLEEHMIELKAIREMAKIEKQYATAVKAEELRGGLCGYYVLKVEHDTTNDFAKMSNQELRDFIVEEAQALAIELPAPRPSDSTNH